MLATVPWEHGIERKTEWRIVNSSVVQYLTVHERSGARQWHHNVRSDDAVKTDVSLPIQSYTWHKYCI